MDDGIETISRGSSDAPRRREKAGDGDGDGDGDDNKFQKAIGAWRSNKPLSARRSTAPQADSRI